ncbi:MAG: DNA polymerase III subunit gamma/tau [Chloroflexi bacterium]|nr:DNA polymerase III subunit gamma/tau [Chloroflexota bacterium]
MSGTVLYRKWRPADFDEVVGQEPVVRTLKNAVAQDKISHAYLFCGPRGTGKTTTARILARAINGRTASSGAAALGESDDLGFDLVEIDAASNRGIDDIRELRERANYRPGSARFKVYLVDEVHQLTGAAADALLKTLEEPPPHVVFILATTDPEALKPTILSRCQRFDFRRVGVDDMVSRLRAIAESEGIEIPDEALRLIAREATGSLRDGVNLLDQVWVMCGSSVALEAAQEALGLSPDARAMELASAALRGKLAEGLGVLAAVQEDAIDFGRFKRQVVTHLRHVLLTLTGATGTLSLSAPELERLEEVSKGVEASAAVTALKAFSEADVRRDPYQPLPLELALASIVYGPPTVEVAMPIQQQRPQRQQWQDGQRRQGQADGQRRQGQRRDQQSTRNLPRAPGQSERAAATQQNQRPAPPPSPPPERTKPESQPSNLPSGSAGPSDLLDQIRAALRQRNQGLIATMLNGSCRIAAQTDDSLTLGFLPTYQQVHMQKVTEALTDVSAAASAVLKRQITVRCVPLDNPAQASGNGSQGQRTQQNPQQSQQRQEGQQGQQAQQRRESVVGREARSRFGARPYQAN